MIKRRIPEYVYQWLRTHATHPDRAVRREAWRRYMQWLDHQRGVLL